jgi:hypothetical protein
MMPESGTVHLVLGYTDMRKSIDTLSIRLSRLKDINPKLSVFILGA